MKEIIKYILLLVIIVFTGCGGGSSGVYVVSSSEESAQGKALLGNLANAQVKIFKIEEDGTQTLLYSETTSDGTRLEEIGNFSTHNESLDSEMYYLYKIIGGEDWDANDDGVKDLNPTTNNGSINLVSKGSDVKNSADNLKVTYTSDLIYRKVMTNINYKFDKNTFNTVLNKAAQEVIGADVNNDGKIDNLDAMDFNPVTDVEKLKTLYKDNISDIINNIHKGKYLLLDIDNFISTFDTDSDARSVSLSSDGTKAYVADYSSGLQIIDISDSTNPTLLGTFDTSGYARSVSLSSDGTKAYVADGNTGLQIIDLMVFNP